MAGKFQGVELASRAIAIRTSDRGYFKKCRQLWDLTSRIRQDWEPIQRYPAFDFGTAIHAGLEAYYKPETWGDLPTMRSNACAAFRESFAALQKIVKVGDLEFELRFQDDIQLGIDMLEYYFTWAPKQDHFKPVFTEIEFEVPIPGLGVPYQGRIDLVVEDEYGYWIADHKSCKQFGDSSWLALDDQCSSYAWSLRQQLGLEIRGVIYNQLRKKPPAPPKLLKNGTFSVNRQQDTSFEVYLRTLRQHGIDPHYYRDILLYLKRNPKEYVRRTKISYNNDILDKVSERIQKEARDMIDPDIQIYPSPSPINCNGCRFFAPCLQIQEGREPVMDMYEQRTALTGYK